MILFFTPLFIQYIPNSLGMLLHFLRRIEYSSIDIQISSFGWGSASTSPRWVAGLLIRARNFQRYGACSLTVGARSPIKSKEPSPVSLALWGCASTYLPKGSVFANASSSLRKKWAVCATPSRFITARNSRGSNISFPPSTSFPIIYLRYPRKNDRYLASDFCVVYCFKTSVIDQPKPTIVS